MTLVACVGQGLVAAVRGAAALVAASAAIYVWCLAVFAMLGYAPAETVFVMPFCILLPMLSVLDRVVCAFVRRMRPMRRAGHAAIGFLLAAGMAGVWIALLGERPLEAGNEHDMALAGLVFGVPSGVLSFESSKASRNIVDTILRVL